MKHKTFKEYITGKKSAIYPFTTLAPEVTIGKLPEMETCCGAHSVKSDGAKLPDMETVFGQHSTKPLTEEYSTEPGKLTTDEQLSQHDRAAGTLIHASNKIKKTDDLKDYSNTSTDINDSLHKKKATKEVKSQIASIDKSLNGASIDKDTHVYTGLRDNPASYFKNLKPGETAKVHLPAYTSTSTDYKIATNFAYVKPLSKEERERHSPLNSDHHDIKDQRYFSHVLKIHLPRGTKAGSIRHFAVHPTEKEILLHRGHNIEIHPHPTVDEDGTHTWHARVISHTPRKV